MVEVEMRNALLRKTRGLLGIGITWAIVWALFAIVNGFAIGLVQPDSIDPGEGPLLVGRIIGLIGFLSGLSFGLLLALGERRKTLLNLSLNRVALWGMLGAAAPLLLTGLPDGMMVIMCPLGAACASASVAIARRAALHDVQRRKLLESAPASI